MHTPPNILDGSLIKCLLWSAGSSPEICVLLSANLVCVQAAREAAIAGLKRWRVEEACQKLVTEKV